MLKRLKHTPFICFQQIACDFSLAKTISCGRPQKGCPAA